MKFVLALISVILVYILINHNLLKANYDYLINFRVYFKYLHFLFLESLRFFIILNTQISIFYILV